jgi:hypothetical protein
MVFGLAASLQLIFVEGEMATISWFSGAVGAVFGAVLGIVGDWQVGARLRRRSARQALTSEYWSLTGDYVNYRVTESGGLEPTGETVRIRWEPREGVLKAAGLRANGDTEWHSDIRMSMEIKGTGSGHYHYVDSIHSGVQQVIYLKLTKSFSVIGTGSTRNQFTHYWKLFEETRE